MQSLFLTQCVLKLEIDFFSSFEASSFYSIDN